MRPPIVALTIVIALLLPLLEGAAAWSSFSKISTGVGPPSLASTRASYGEISPKRPRADAEAESRPAFAREHSSELRRGLAEAAADGRGGGTSGVLVDEQQSRGGIRGRFDIGRKTRTRERRPEVSEVGAQAPRDALDLRRGVVYLETAPAAALEGIEPVHAVLDQRNETFVPHVLAVTAGTVVDFPNNDRTYHNVFSLSRAKRFDLGRYPAGRSKPVQFDRPGVIRVFCDIHPHMSAFVLVFNHRFFGIADQDGRFRIDNVPPGTYNVIAWYEGEARANRSVQIAPGTIADLDFVVP